MADIRELVILSPSLLDAPPESPMTRRLMSAKMTLRRLIVRSSGVPVMQRLYTGIYRLHLRIAAAVGKWFAGTRAVYLTSGMATGEVNLGISDVDIAMYGEWPEKKQFTLMKIFGACTFLSPLFDKRSLATIGTIDDLKHLCATDMFMAMNHAKGALQWKLLYGRNVLAELPAISAERFPGCVYMDVRRWWSMLATTSFGDDITGRDTIFRNSICYKSAAEMLRAERMLHGGINVTGRTALLEEELGRQASEPLQHLLSLARSRFLGRDRDPRGATLSWFLTRAETFHKATRHTQSFAFYKDVQTDGSFEEVWVDPQVDKHAEMLLGLAKAEWPSLRAAYLVPSVTMFAIDSLALLLEPDSQHLPTINQLQHIAALHRQAAALPQRLALYLLLPEAAYQLDASASLEFFHFTLSPDSTPDVFLTITIPQFCRYKNPDHDLPEDGARLDRLAHLHWSYFSQELLAEELTARLGAYKRFGMVSQTTALANLRNVWRLFQLLVIKRSAKAQHLTLPFTRAAVRRALLAWKPALAEELSALESAYETALRGEVVQVTGLSEMISSVHAQLLICRNDVSASQ